MSKKEEKMDQELLGLDEKDLTLIGVSGEVSQAGAQLLIGKKMHYIYKGIDERTEKAEKSKIRSKVTNKNIIHRIKKIFKTLNKMPKNKNTKKVKE